MSRDRTRPIISHSATWMIGAVASAIALSMIYVAWLGSNVFDIEKDVADVKANVSHLCQLTKCVPSSEGEADGDP